MATHSQPPNVQPTAPQSAAQPAAAQPSAAQISTLDIYADFAHQAQNDNRGLKVSLFIAAIIHGVLLLITFPTLYSDELRAEKPPEDVIRLAPTPIWKKPPPPRVEAPKPRAVRIPIPDPTPDDPEPLYVEPEEPVIELPQVDGIPLDIPDRPPAPELTGPVHPGGNVTKPQRIHYVEPRYTEIARKVREEGIVILQTVIDVNGNVQDVKVLKSLRFGLTEAAVEAVEQWKYEPGLLNGKPVAVYLSLTVNFTLQ